MIEMVFAVLRQRLIRIGTWILLVLVLLAWAISLAIKAPWTPWFTIILWAVIGIGFIVRIASGIGKKQEALDAFRDVNEIFQGRIQTPYGEAPPVESSEVGRPFQDAQAPLPEEE